MGKEDGASIALLHDLCIDDNDHVYRVRRAIKGITKKRKKNVDYSRSKFKCGVEIPRSVKHAKQLDEDNNNSLWMDALDLEMSTLISYCWFAALKIL